MRYSIPILLITAFWGCRDQSKVVTPIPNTSPVADAGADQSLSADEAINLDGGGSYDPDGDSLSYSWSFSRVPEGSTLAESENPFSNNNMATSQTSFFPDLMGTYIVSLTVTDIKGNVSPSDSVIVTVTEGQLPVSMAGMDQNVVEGETVLLDGSASYDPMGRELSYQWNVASAPSSSVATIADPTNPITSFTPDLPGSYLVSLVVDSGVNISNPDVLTVKVQSANPEAPVASAAAGTELLEDCSDIPLDGGASMDPNGESLSYYWTLQDKPLNSTITNNSFSDRNISNPTLYTDMAGEYLVSLAVNDGTEWSSPDLITLNVGERIANSSPAVNAGNSQSLDAGDAECEPSGYSYSCASCEDLSITLGDGASVNDPDGDTFSTTWSVLSGDADISNAQSIQTTVVLKNAEPEEPGACTATVYEIQLSATDCPGTVSSDSVSFTVNCCGVEAAASQ
ncbi:MAG: PKD domain-containing protein [Myxococcota bacterium]|nr:PKD domain-containing protein [Myxococcota bacterium]